MKKINKICLWALGLRVVVLILVAFFSDKLPTGFLSSDIINDDVRYLAGAEVYARTAKSIIDVNALGSAYFNVDDYTIAYGNEFKLWYWMISIGMFLFQNQYLVRLFNIFFAVICIKFIYDIASKQYGERVGILASSLYAFFPYPVIFSCFLYKDQFYTLLVLMMFREIILYGKNLKFFNYVKLGILIIASISIRSGLIVPICILLIVIYYSNNKNNISKIRLAFFSILFIVSVLVITFYSVDTISRKFSAYVLESEVPTSGLISYATIKSYTDIYRYPIAFLFALLLPINTSGTISTWAAVASSLNIVSLPIAIGVLLYLLYWGYKRDTMFWCIQILYLITIVTSLGIFRHQYYLQPFMMIMFACFYYSLRINYRKPFLTIMSIMTGLYGVMIYVMY